MSAQPYTTVGDLDDLEHNARGDSEVVIGRSAWNRLVETARLGVASASENHAGLYRVIAKLLATAKIEWPNGSTPAEWWRREAVAEMDWLAAASVPSEPPTSRPPDPINDAGGPWREGSSSGPSEPPRSITGKFVENVYHKAKRASDGPTKEDAIAEAWDAVAGIIDAEIELRESASEPPAAVSDEEVDRKLLREVAASALEFDDPRVGYVTLQVDRPVWNAVICRAALGILRTDETLPADVAVLEQDGREVSRTTGLAADFLHRRHQP